MKRRRVRDTPTRSEHFGNLQHLLLLSVKLEEDYISVGVSWESQRREGKETESWPQVLETMLESAPMREWRNWQTHRT